MRRRVFRSCLLILALVPAAAGGCSANPLTGRRDFMLLSPAQEIQLGREAGPALAEEFGGPYDDSAIQQYVRSVGRKVADEALKVGHPYEYGFTVLDSSVVNAFALPGGPVYITRGLLFELQDESQLAAVLAHEVTHVAARHSAKKISGQMGAGFILSVLSAAAGKGESAGSTSTDAAEGIARIVAGLVSLKYSRNDETEADLYGLDFLVRAGYQPLGMVRVMEMFEAEERREGGGGFEFLRTHRSPKNRIRNIQAVIDREYPGAPTDPRLTVGRETYERRVLARRSRSLGAMVLPQVGP